MIWSHDIHGSKLLSRKKSPQLYDGTLNRPSYYRPDVKQGRQTESNLDA